MVPHCLEGFSASLQGLAERLCLLEFHGVDLRRIKVTSELTQLLGGIIFAPLGQTGGHVKRVDHPPGKLLRELLHARVFEDIEDRSDSHLHGAARHVGIGHFSCDRFIDDAQLGKIAVLDKGTVVGFDDTVTAVGEFDARIGEISEAVEFLHG